MSRVERRAAPRGAEPGHEQFCGLFVPGEGSDLVARRGLQDRPMYSSHEGQS